MNAAHKVPQPTNQASAPANDDFDDEITIECRVKVQAPAEPAPSRRTTTRLTAVDARLLAIARGEVEPDHDDPFGGLIPIYDNDDEAALATDEAWLKLEPEPPSSDADEFLFGQTVPVVRMRASELFALPLEPRSTFFLSQIDGRRTVEELVHICGLDDLSGLEIVDELLRLGAIELR